MASQVYPSYLVSVRRPLKNGMGKRLRANEMCVMGQGLPKEVGIRLPRAYDQRSIIPHFKSQSGGFLCTCNCYGRAGEFPVLPFSCENDGFLQFVENGDKKEREHGWCVSQGEGLQEAGQMLCRFIDEHDLLDSDKGPRWPLVVLAFDEADSLTDNPPEQVHWNLFSELRRVLRQIRDLPIFSLFLSTAGRFDKFSPVIRDDPSAAREPDNRPLDPISEISFDDIAYPALKGTITIHDAVAIDWISHLGRPLYVYPSYLFRELLSYHLE
jgi:hypothetical protein